MRRILFDTSVLVRLSNADDPNNRVAVRALARLRASGFRPCLTPQVPIEWRSVATRPKEENGLGIHRDDATDYAASYEASFPVLPDTPDIYGRWKEVVMAREVEGKTVHDARLVAVCHVHSVTHLLTFNTRHFDRLAAYPPPLIVVHPARV